MGGTNLAGIPEWHDQSIDPHQNRLKSSLVLKQEHYINTGYKLLLWVAVTVAQKPKLFTIYTAFVP